MLFWLLFSVVVPEFVLVLVLVLVLALAVVLEFLVGSALGHRGWNHDFL